jgi:acyl-CoA synthetase (AMP-forming)/AMP-acid ligase II
VIHESPHPPADIPDISLAEYVLADAHARGDRPALVDAATGRTLTYAGLDALARGVASGLQGRGLAPGQVVGVLAPNVPEYAAAYFGVALAGGVATTINGLYTEGEIAHQLQSSRARFLFTVSALLDRALPAAAAAGVEAVFSFDGGDGTTALRDMLAPADELRPAGVDPATALVALPYSSGTTGLPKGVMLTHRNLVANVVQTLAVVPGGDEIVAGILPFFTSTARPRS